MSLHGMVMSGMFARMDRHRAGAGVEPVNIYNGVDPGCEEPSVLLGLRPTHLVDKGGGTVDGALQQRDDGLAPRTHPGAADEQSTVVDNLLGDGRNHGHHESDVVVRTAV